MEKTGLSDNYLECNEEKTAQNWKGRDKLDSTWTELALTQDMTTQDWNGWKVAGLHMNWTGLDSKHDNAGLAWPESDWTTHGQTGNGLQT